MHFYKLEMDALEKRTAADIKRNTSMPFSPYVVRGSQRLRGQIGFDMISGNTITTPGFYAPQGRVVRLRPKYPKLLDELTNYGAKSRKFRLTNFEMETAGYYSLARMLGHDALSVNAIIANRAGRKFSKAPNEVIDALIRKVLERC
jgi:uridine phosphorylase